MTRLWITLSVTAVLFGCDSSKSDRGSGIKPSNSRDVSGRPGDASRENNPKVPPDPDLPTDGGTSTLPDPTTGDPSRILPPPLVQPLPTPTAQEPYLVVALRRLTSQKVRSTTVFALPMTRTFELGEFWSCYDRLTDGYVTLHADAQHPDQPLLKVLGRLAMEGEYEGDYQVDLVHQGVWLRLANPQGNQGISISRSRSIVGRSSAGISFHGVYEPRKMPITWDRVRPFGFHDDIDDYLAAISEEFPDRLPCYRQPEIVAPFHSKGPLRRDERFSETLVRELPRIEPPEVIHYRHLKEWIDIIADVSPGSDRHRFSGYQSHVSTEDLAQIIDFVTTLDLPDEAHRYFQGLASDDSKGFLEGTCRWLSLFCGSTDISVLYALHPSPSSTQSLALLRYLYNFRMSGHQLRGTIVDPDAHDVARVYHRYDRVEFLDGRSLIFGMTR